MCLAISESSSSVRKDPAARYAGVRPLIDDLNAWLGHRPVSARRDNWRHNTRLWLKVFLDPEQDTSPASEWNRFRDEHVIEKGDAGLKLPSVTGVWPGAEWMEREVYDMFGIVFVGHPDLRRILTWNGYGSYPLRKDYPLRGVGERENYKIVTREGA